MIIDRRRNILNRLDFRISHPLFITISMCISGYYACIFKDIEIHIKYRNKKWVTNSKCAPLNM